VKLPLLLACIFLLLAACAARQRDSFYVLDAQPATAVAPRESFDRQLTLLVTVPSMVDRAEMVVTTSAGVSVVDHHRWAAPLADLITTTLGQDIERRRADIVVLQQSAARAGAHLSKISIEVVQLSARPGDQVSMEVRWRISDAKNGKQSLGREVFSSSVHTPGYAALATALSSCVGSLADRLIQELPAS
jgi:uncharacterized protein